MLRRSARILKRPVENDGLTETRRVRTRGAAPGPAPGPIQENYEKRTVPWLVKYARDRVITEALAGNLRKADMIARIRQFDNREAELTRQREEIRLQEAEAGDVPMPGIPAFVERGAKMVPQLPRGDLFSNIEWYETHDTHASTQDRDTWWRMEKRVGLGAYGYVSFWVKIDHTGIIIDRIVLKDQLVSLWNTHNRLAWAYDRGSHVRPLEADIHARLFRRNERQISKYRGCQYDDRTYVFRMYTEFARFGNLWDLMKKYVSCKKRPESKSNWNSDRTQIATQTRSNCIPEAFIWYVAQELVRAIRTMRDGCDEDGEISPENAGRPWAEVLHLDLKPPNILLGEIASEDVDAALHQWPTIVITDFGISAEVQTEWNNPKDYAGRGTPGYMAPEQFRQINRDQALYPEQQFTSKTNVWGVGAVLYDLCNPSPNDGKYGTGGPCWRDEAEERRRRYIHVDLAEQPPGNLNPEDLKWRKLPARRETSSEEPEEEKHVYSEALRTLIAQCLEYYPARRPTIENLLAAIRVNRDKFDDLDAPFEDMGDEEISLEGASMFKLDSMDDVYFPVVEVRESESDADA
ncbi:hypothetical protein EG327_000178 [Venturia inaequalis]|uniref:non-specific serine/threonine protein kinase n=1 Tax=Venturia inaequalis TaxID=5025 RepID=A0A8H3VLB8_VENIN|nr:hypothetical protein EG327_000178 [Venturia inaequalis]